MYLVSRSWYLVRRNVTRNESGSTIPVSILDIATGKKTPWKEIYFTQPVVEIHDLYMTPDGQSYAYNYVLMQSDLYIARGLH